MNSYFRNLPVILAIAVIFTSCNPASPEKNFQIAVLNSNLYSGFAGERQLREFEQPSAKLGSDGTSTETMKSSEVLKMKITAIEESYDKVKDLKKNDDTKDIIEAAEKIYELILPVYNNEYTKLAELYDSKAPKEQSDLLAASISEKYQTRFNELYGKLINAGKAYASKHSIKVNWGNM